MATPRKLDLLLTWLTAVVLSLAMVAAGSRIPGQLDGDAAAPTVAVADQASNQHGPGQPPPRLLDAELQEDSEDETDDERTPLVAIADARVEFVVANVTRVAIVDSPTAAAERVRTGHGARGPPTC